MATDDQTPKNELLKIRTEFVEKISVAGWREAFDEHVIWIRRFFQLSMSILFCFSLVTLCREVKGWRSSGYKDQFADTGHVDSLPFSNVTVCAQIYFNRTFVEENFIIPKTIRDQIRRGASEYDLAEFYRRFTLFLSFMARPRSYDQDTLARFAHVMRANEELLRDYWAFARRAVPTCESVLRRCWFDGREFDCCRRAVVSLDDDGVCFQLVLNQDSDNALPTPLTVRQTRAGPAGGLKIEASLDTDDFPWYEDDAQNGFKLLVSPIPYTASESPVTAPHDAETFIQVVPVLNSLATGCTPQGRLDTFEPMGGGHVGYYDPEGMSCVARGMLRMNMKYVSCEMVGFTHRPNRSVECGPYQNYIVMNMITNPEQWAKRADGTGSKFTRQIQNQIAAVEADWKSTFSSTGSCPHHCRFWRYRSSASFVDIVEEKHRNTSSKEHRPKRMYSIIHVYYAHLEYRHYYQVKQVSTYLAFYTFCNIYILYFGMSVVSYFHLWYYVPRYLYALWKHGRWCGRIGGRSTRRVEPMREEAEMQ